MRPRRTGNRHRASSGSVHLGRVTAFLAALAVLVGLGLITVPMVAVGARQPQQAPRTRERQRLLASPHAPRKPGSAKATTSFNHIGKYQVGTVRFAIVEHAGPGGYLVRPLPTRVWYPAYRSAGRLVPDRSDAPYPLVVFSQGYDIPVSAYEGLLVDLASAGFVVAAPTYPYTVASYPGGLDEADIVNHPADLRFVIAALLHLAGQPGSALTGLVNPARVGLMGHSDGGDVSLAVADNTCCRDPLVKAVAVLSGAELVSFGGEYFTGPPVPILVAQGSADTVNVPACSTQIYDAARGPKYYLDLFGAEHEPPYAGPLSGPKNDRLIVAQVATYFFDAELGAQKGALAAIARAGDVPRTSLVSIGGQLPSAPGGCPGAPEGTPAL
ncbi:MAG: alpha/beta hydrolase family protein [Acidimicrobiales bacterium]